MPTLTGQLAVRNEIDRVSGTSVFRESIVIVVWPASDGIDDYVFQHTAKADGIPDLRLTLARQPDALRVAAAFDIKNAVVGPAVFVVADQPAFRIGGERRLARARQTKEQSRPAVGADVGRTVHRKDAALGQ